MLRTPFSRIRTALLTPESEPSKTHVDTSNWVPTLRERLIAFHDWGDYIAEETRYPSIIARQIFIIPLSVLLLATGIAAAWPGGGVLQDAILNGLIEFVLKMFVDGSAENVPDSSLSRLLLFGFSTPVPPDSAIPFAKHSIASSASGTSSQIGMQTLGVSSLFWDDIVRLNESSKLMVLPAISLYFAYYLFLTGIHAVRPSERDMAIVKGFIAIGLISINLELYGIILAIVRVLTLIFLSNPVQLTENLMKGTFAMFATGGATAMFGGFGIVTVLSLLALFVLVIFVLVLLARIPMILGTAALFPWIITGYLFGQVFRPVEAVMDRVFGYVYPMMFVTIPAAAIVWMTSLIFSGIEGGMATGSPMEAAVKSSLLSFLGIGTFIMGLLIVVKSTSTGAKMVSGTKKAVGTAAMIGGVAALGGGGGAMFRTGAMTMRYGKGAGMLSGLGEAYRESHEKISDAQREAQQTGKGIGVDIKSPMDQLAAWRHKRKGEDRDEFLSMDMGEYEVTPDPEDAIELDPDMSALNAIQKDGVHADAGKIKDRVHEWEKRTEDDPDAAATPSVQDLLDTFDGDTVGDYFGNVSLESDEHTAKLPEKQLARIDKAMDAFDAAKQAEIDNKPIEGLVDEWRDRMKGQGEDDPGYPTVGELSETFGKSIEELYGNVEVVNDPEIGAQARYNEQLEDAPYADEQFTKLVMEDGIDGTEAAQNALPEWGDQQEGEVGEDFDYSEATVGDLRKIAHEPILEEDGGAVFDFPDPPDVAALGKAGSAMDDGARTDSIISPNNATTGSSPSGTTPESAQATGPDYRNPPEPPSVDFVSGSSAGDTVSQGGPGVEGPEEEYVEPPEEYNPFGANVSRGLVGDPDSWLNPDSDIDFTGENLEQSHRVWQDSLDFLSSRDSVRNTPLSEAEENGWKFEGGRKSAYKVMSGIGMADGTLGGYFDKFGGGGIRDFAASDLEREGFGFSRDAESVYGANPDIGFGALMHHSRGPTVIDAPEDSNGEYATFRDEAAARHVIGSATEAPGFGPESTHLVKSANIHPDSEYLNGKSDPRTGEVSIPKLPHANAAAGEYESAIKFTKSGSGTIESEMVTHDELNGYSNYIRLFQSAQDDNKLLVDSNLSPKKLQNDWSRIKYTADPRAPGEVSGDVSGAEIRNLIEQTDRGTKVVLDRHSIGGSIEGDIGGETESVPEDLSQETQ